MPVKLISFFYFILCLASCVHQPKYEYSIEVTSESIKNSTIERLKERLSTLGSHVEISKKNDQKVSIRFKSSFEDSIIENIIETKGNLAFHEIKDINKMMLTIGELSTLFPLDSVTTQSDFYNKFHPSLYEGSAELGYVEVKDTSMFNKSFVSPEIRRYLNKQQLQVKFSWGLFDNQASGIPLYALNTSQKKYSSMHGDIVAQASAGYTQMGIPSISIVMQELQAEKWERLTRRAAEERFFIAIVVDETVVMAPRVLQVIKGGNIEISGNLKKREAFVLSVILNSGPIEELEIVSLHKQELR